MEIGTIKKQIKYLLFLLAVFVCAGGLILGVLPAEICAEPSGEGAKTEQTILSSGQETLTEQTLWQPEQNEEQKTQTVEQLEQQTQTAELDLSAPSAILMEASTGQVIYEKDADSVRSPASITKIMTMLLIFEQLRQGKIGLTDEVVTSAYAKSMGGSQVFLEEGEVQTVDTMIKCIAVASGNDASVAMAEKIAGSEDAFVEMMNEKARVLGMTNTHFEDCSGLTTSENHYTSARDIACMARVLVTEYPEVYDYTKIWMEDIVHVTPRGSKNFTLSSTNKLLKQYPYTTGLKTGSTSIAKYCFCATARRDDIDLIAVVMGAPEPKGRFADAKKLLEYGFAKSQLYQDEEPMQEIEITVNGGKTDRVKAKQTEKFRYLDVTGADISTIEKQVECAGEVDAPVESGQKAGEIVYRLNGRRIGSVDLFYENAVSKATFTDFFQKVCRKMLL